MVEPLSVLVIPLSLASLALPFPTDSLETGTPALRTLGSEKAFLLHVAQNPALSDLFTKTPE